MKSSSDAKPPQPNQPPRPPGAPRAPRAPRGAKGLKHHARLDQFTPEVRRTAACVLEVLAGVRTPEQAAQTLELTLPTYYNVETRALRGLIAGCSTEVPGRSMVLAKKLRGAEIRASSLEKQVQRYQALLRAAQRSVGLAPPTPPVPTSHPSKSGSKRRRKKPSVRALRAVAALRDGVGVGEGVGVPAEASLQSVPAQSSVPERACEEVVG